GKTIKEVAGKDFLEHLHVVELYNILKEALQKKGEIFTHEVSLPDIVSGSARVFKTIGTTVMSRKNQLLGVVTVFRDITHEKEVDRMKSEFVNIASHELRTPLSSIKIYTEFLLEGQENEDTEKEYLSIIADETERLTNLVNDMLDLSRIESGKIKISKETVNISEIIDKSIEILAPSAESKNVNIHKIMPPEFPDIFADKNMIQQVIINLVSNSIKYSDTNKDVHISAEKNGRYIKIAVADSGFGIPEKDIQHVFDKFYRVENEKTANIEGTGLGLPMVKYIIEKHGGDITVNSEFGKGSLFAFTLPI
ncbi:MAG: ATP-binding protein, partial [bacterium]